MPSSAVLLLLRLLAFTYAQTDPCVKGNHRELDEPNRSTAIRLKPGSIGDTDEFLKKDWYRFVSGAGGEIPTSAPQAGQCNTKKPIWLNGKQPPLDGKIHTLNMCYYLSADEPCGIFLQIRAKNCKEFVIYELVPTNSANSTQIISNASYCAGSEKLCPPGQTSITGFTPNCSTTTTVTSTSVRSTSLTSASLPVMTPSSKTHRDTTTSSATPPDTTPSGSSANRNSLAVIGFALLLIVNCLCQK